MAKRSGVASLHGQAALERLYRGHRRAGPGILFLDIDDVLTLSQPYGGYDLFQIAEEQPADLYSRLWHPLAAQTLLAILHEMSPRVVLTTSWLRLMDQSGFESLFHRTGLRQVADSLHSAWAAPAIRDMTRHDAIQRWLVAHHLGEPLVVLDDDTSGTGLKGSRLDRLGYVVWCSKGVGLNDGHLPQVRKALGV